MSDLPDIGLGVPDEHPGAEEPDERKPPEEVTDDETRIESENDLA